MSCLNNYSTQFYPEQYVSRRQKTVKEQERGQKVLILYRLLKIIFEYLLDKKRIQLNNMILGNLGMGTSRYSALESETAVKK